MELCIAAKDTIPINGNFSAGTEVFLSERFSAQRNEVQRALPSELMNTAVPNKTFIAASLFVAEATA